MADRMPGHYNLDGSYHPAPLLVGAQYVSIMPIVLGHSFSWMAAFPDRNSLTSCKCLSVTLCTIAILGLDWPIEPLLHKEWPIDHLLSILWPSASSAMCCTKHRSLIPFNGNTWCLSICLYVSVFAVCVLWCQTAYKYFSLEQSVSLSGRFVSRICSSPP